MLEGVRVIDLSQYIPGPFASRQLADLGAEVIKIEPPSGDPMRRLFSSGNDDISPIYRHLNRGKKIYRLDLKSNQGKTAFTELLGEANVLLESFRPGVLEKLGFSRKKLEQSNPALVHCALSGYGQTGPYRERAGHDINYLAASSALSVSGTVERPVMPYPPLADHAGAMQASTAILAALYTQQRKDVGSYLDISLLEACLSWQYLPFFEQATNRAEGLLSGGAACYNIYACADGKFISLGALEAHFWSTFCEAVDRPDWKASQHDALPQKQLIAELENLFVQKPREYWDRQLDNVDCCYQALVTPAELPQQDYIRARSSMNPQGPTYPGLINQASVSVKAELDEYIHDESPYWS